MRIRNLIWAAAAAVALAGPAGARADDFVPGEVVVGYRAHTDASEQARIEQATSTHDGGALPGGFRLLTLGARDTVGAAIARLRRDPDVSYAVPDYTVQATDFIPDDTGAGGIDGWERLQWNFVGPWSVDAPRAWALALQAGAPGGRGVTVAVIDSGVAFERYKWFRRAPDLAASTFVDPHDFLKNDRHPDDEEGHGTAVAGTIAEETNNRLALTGLAYGAKIMPLRVLDSHGLGGGAKLARAIRYAVDHGARVINLSVGFDPALDASNIPEVISAIDYATRRNVVVVAAAGNDGVGKLSYPARDPEVISVGATTADGCLAGYSNWAAGMTLVAPGGGGDAPLFDSPMDRRNCRPARPGRGVFQQTFIGNVDHFALVSYEGTSLAAPHVAAAAALLIASKRLGPDPTPAEVAARLAQTARPLGAGAGDPHYGAGLLDAGAALAP